MAADNVKFGRYVLYDVLFLGDVKLYFGRDSKGNFVRAESPPNTTLPKFTSNPVVPPTHKFVASPAEVG